MSKCKKKITPDITTDCYFVCAIMIIDVQRHICKVDKERTSLPNNIATFRPGQDFSKLHIEATNTT